MATDLSNSECFLTPGHFLIGGPLLQIPEVSLLDVSLNRLSRWQIIQQTLQQFWHLWRTSYLQTLMPRKKWQSHSPTLKVGDVVIVKNVNTPPQYWPLGRITNLFPDVHGVSHVAKVLMGGRVLTRAVHTLIPMIMENLDDRI